MAAWMKRFYQMSASDRPVEITRFHPGSDTCCVANHIYFERLEELDGMAPNQVGFMNQMTYCSM